MMSAPANYEFDQQQDAVFAKLAAAMSFVGFAMCVPAVLLGVGAIMLRSTPVVSGICAVAALLLVSMGVLKFRAAGHFRLIVKTKGTDLENLTIAVAQLTEAYDIERWLWMVLAAVVVIALASTATGYSQ